MGLDRGLGLGLGLGPGSFGDEEPTDLAAEQYYAEMSAQLGIVYQTHVDSSAFVSRKPRTVKPELLKTPVAIGGGFVMRAVEIPREVTRSSSRS